MTSNHLNVLTKPMSTCLRIRFYFVIIIELVIRALETTTQFIYILLGRIH